MSIEVRRSSSDEDKWQPTALRDYIESKLHFSCYQRVAYNDLISLKQISASQLLIKMRSLTFLNFRPKLAGSKFYCFLTICEAVQLNNATDRAHTSPQVHSPIGFRNPIDHHQWHKNQAKPFHLRLIFSSSISLCQLVNYHKQMYYANDVRSTITTQIHYKE